MSGWDPLGTGRLLARARSVNANSLWTKDSVARHCPGARERIAVIYYGGAIPGPAAAPPPVRRPFILCAARLAEYKGLDILVMAFARLLESRPELSLVLCGEDCSRGRLGAFIRKLGLSDRIVWLGPLPHPQVLALMRECLFFVLPSRRESLGGAILEALQAGKAVVATRVGGIPELVRDGEEGLLVEPGSVESLARAMLRLAEDDGLRRACESRARERSRLFSWDNALDAYQALYPKDGKAAVLVWEREGDATAQAYLHNLARGLSARGRPLALCVWRDRLGPPFRGRACGVPLYRLGLPGAGPLNALLVALQLLWIARSERIAVWHPILLRYRRLRGLLWFLAWTRNAPVLTLA